MAFGIKRDELRRWKSQVEAGEIAFLTHYWADDRFPGHKTVTKAGCQDIERLKAWGRRYGLKPEWIHVDEEYPHFDLIGQFEEDILQAEGKLDQLRRFRSI
ncbi:hypothetical protein [Alkalibacillus almallahensis]|uniref:hypothetical protein n=1 Tax=Alkalibacillus almallahensis TaxID=1379154 RepID=UPI0014235181|nr:hypothetical protein [Alkalibacillus almallahensis]NIK10970.1 hypothetical protein [Alkalibacillus almallahensis]